MDVIGAQSDAKRLEHLVCSERDRTFIYIAALLKVKSKGVRVVAQVTLRVLVRVIAPLRFLQLLHITSIELVPAF